jgi:hypothetical protein
MICITSLADNTWRVPPDGRMPAGYVTNLDVIEGRLKGMEYVAGTQKKWFPGDPGPGVLMNGDFKDDKTVPATERMRNPWYEGKPAVPFWKDPATYFVSNRLPSRRRRESGASPSCEGSNIDLSSRSSRSLPARTLSPASAS